ncbi:MAG TPA: TIGR03086 family metal-binding protein [Actinomycetes bacterium]|nr:TIGR03086 family metal-binding protein [Actinomycetes bacterium]
MTGRASASALTGGIGLLERAFGYTLGSLNLVTPAEMANPTPCAGWDLRALLRHMNDSLLAVHEAIAAGEVGLDPPPSAGDSGDPEADPVGVLRNRGCRILGAWVNADDPGQVAIADRALTPTILVATAAIEIAVHGWDVARACGQDRPIPPALAGELLELCPLFVSDADRRSRFGASVPVSPDAPASDRLAAYLGRDPQWRLPDAA